MSMIYVLGDSQGEGPVENGTIVVTYPAGATCTVTNGSQTYTALDTSGAAAFIVEPGTWTVTAVQGSNTKSQSVTVTAGGWVEVELMFELVLYQNGVWEQNITGGWEKSTVRYMQIGGQNSGIAPTVEYINDENTTDIYIAENNGHSGSYNTKNKIDLSNYSKLIVTGVVTAGATADQCGICFASSKTEFLLNYSVANKTFSESGETFNDTTVINLANINSSTYFCIGMYASTIFGVKLLKLVP